jgi:hypothetical protein
VISNEFIWRAIMEQFDPKLIAFAAALVVMTVLLFRGISVIIASAEVRKETQRSLLMEALSEKTIVSVGDEKTAPAGKVGSFSRTAGAFGAMSLAAAVIGVAYWMVYALFYDQDVKVLKEASWFFLSGSALFAPYAFNQLSSVFKT